MMRETVSLQENYLCRSFPLFFPKVLSEEQKAEFIEKTSTGEECFTGEGISVNSEMINGLKTPEAISKVIQWLERK
jgi:hypothetical protein